MRIKYIGVAPIEAYVDVDRDLKEVMSQYSEYSFENRRYQPACHYFTLIGNGLKDAFLPTNYNSMHSLLTLNGNFEWVDVDANNESPVTFPPPDRSNNIVLNNHKGHDYIIFGRKELSDTAVMDTVMIATDANGYVVGKEGRDKYIRDCSVICNHKIFAIYEIDRNILIVYNTLYLSNTTFNAIFKIINERCVAEREEQWGLFDKMLDVTVGADPEYELQHKGKYVSAAGALRDAYGYESDDGNDLLGDQLGTDGNENTCELRPDAGSPKDVCDSIRELVNKAYRMKFELQPASDILACGCHIHVGLPNRYRNIHSRNLADLIKLFDIYIGRLARKKNTSARVGRTRRRSTYGRLGDWRQQPHGYEYRTPPSTITMKPEWFEAFLEVARLITKKYFTNGVYIRDNLFTNGRAKVNKKDYESLGVPANLIEAIMDCKNTPVENMTMKMCAWVDPEFIPKPVEPTISVSLSPDEFHSSIRDWVDDMQSVLNSMFKLNTDMTVRIFGLKEQRGDVVYGITLEGHETLSIDMFGNQLKSMITIGLPYHLRISDWDNENHTANDAKTAIVNHIKERLVNGGFGCAL